MTETTNKDQLVYLPVSQLSPHPDNPRKSIGDVTELADSIKATGILQNLTVVPNINGPEYGYTVIIGHRRLAAAKQAGLEEVPCVIADMDHREQVQTMLLENMQRSDLTVYEQAQGFQMMLDLGDSVEQIAEKSGFSQTTVRRRVKLLDLNPEKFKESEKRGATLQDYVELEKIEDPELKNEVLGTIGTANFRDALKKAIANEKLRHRMAQWEADLKGFALKIEKRDYVGECLTRMDYVRAYASWLRKDEAVECPEDAGEVEYFYLVKSDQIDLYREHREQGETEEERQRKEKDQVRRRVKAELKEITDRHYSMRVEFVSDFSAIKKHLIEICKYAASVIAGDGEYGRKEIDAELAGELLDLGIDHNTDYPAFTAMVEECAEESPEYVLLVCAYASVEAEGNGYWGERWSADKREYEIVHKPNDELDRLYAFLIALGYEMSDEEKALRDGTHEIFQGEQKEANP